MTFPVAFQILSTGFYQTIYMVAAAGLLGIMIGCLLGTFGFVTQKNGLFENIRMHKMLTLVFNAARTLPFMISVLLLVPLTRWLIGTSDGTPASMIALGIGVSPFIAKLVESTLSEVPSDFIEVSQSMGARPMQIITKVLWRESLPSLIRGMTVILTSLVGYSAMVGAIGGGGLGEVAIRFGYQRFDIKMMIVASALLILLSQLIQLVGDYLAGKVDHRFL